MFRVVIAVLFGITFLFGMGEAEYYYCWDISFANEKYIEFKLKKEFGYRAISKVNKIYKYIVSQSHKDLTSYNYQISFISGIMNKLEKNWCYLDKNNLDGNPYLIWKKLTYQLLRLKLDTYLYRLNTERLKIWLGVRG